MKGDFTRFTFDPTKHYTAVLRQQGRVDLDADWNEYVEMHAYLDQTEARDVIGTCGVPRQGGGFRIGLQGGGNDLSISAGRIYADGMLCELESATSYLKQAGHDYPNPPALTRKEGRTDLVYLDVWHRHVTAIEDPSIREVALGGPDTTTRVKTVWQVRVQKDVTAGRCGAVTGWPPSASGGRMSAGVTAASQSEDPCLIAPGTGYRGLENRFYRVEIHNPGDLGVATFKWSRDNGAVVFSITEFVSSDTVQVRRLKWDAVLGLRVGDWVAVLDDAHELKGQPGTLAEVKAVDEARQTITLSQSVTGYDVQGHPRVRRWDQGKVAIKTATGPIDLEDGVQVSFSGSDFRTGDYWVFAARTITGCVENLKDAPPRGIAHHYCPLALLTWQKSTAGDEGGTTLKAQLAEVEMALKGLKASATVAKARSELQQSAKKIEEMLAQAAVAGETGDSVAELQLQASGIKRALQALEKARTVKAAIKKLQVQAEEVAAALEASEGDASEEAWEATVRDCRRIFSPLGDLRSSCCTVTVGDGICSHGQYEDIQEAIDSLPSHGGRVCILPGQHLLKNSVHIENKSGVVVSGCKPHTWIQMKAGEAVFAISDCTTVRLQDLGFQLAAGAQAVVVTESSDVQVQHNLVVVEADKASGSTAYGTQGLIVADACQQVAISQNRLRGGGVRILTGSSGVVVEGNEISDGPGAGVAFGPGAAGNDDVLSTCIVGAAIRENIIAGMQGSGIAVEIQPNPDVPSSLVATDRLSIERNTIVACAHGVADDGTSVYGGIVLAGGRQLRIEGNHIEGCGPVAAWPAASDSGEAALSIPSTPARTVDMPRLRTALDTDATRMASTASLDLSSEARISMLQPRTAVHAAGSFASLEPALLGGLYLDATKVEESSDAPVAGIYVFQSEGLEINHNRVLNNGSARVDAEAAGRQGGIIVKYASICPLQMKVSDRITLTFSDGYPAAKVHANVVIAPRGPALQIAGIGPMSITGNQLTSQGVFPQPQGEGAPSLTSIGAVQVANLGVADELINFFPGFQALVGLQQTIDLSSQRDPSTSSGTDTPQTRLDGSVLFSDNQVTLNLARPEQELALASVLIISLDDIAFHDNQLDAVLPAQDTILADAMVLGVRARATGNVYKETIGRCYYSYMALALVNTATANQGNHCFFVYGPDASKVLSQDNIALACRLNNAEVARLVVMTTPPEEAEAASKDVLSAAIAYRRVLASADTYRPAALKELRVVEEAKMKNLQAEKELLAAQPDAEDWRVAAVGRELTTANVVSARLGTMVAFEANLS